MADATEHPRCLVELTNLSWTGPGHHPLIACSSFRIHAGELVCVVGSTGSGKSLLLRSLVQLDPVDTGEVRFDGCTIDDHDVPAFRSQVQFLSQRAPSFERTVAEDINAVRTLQAHKGTSGNETVLQEWMNRLELAPSFLEQRTRDLSGGERQLVSLLRSLNTSPQVLLLDEPTAALDPESTLRVESLIQNWLSEENEQRAVMWVSHDQDQVARLSGRLIRVEAGQVSEQTA